MQENHSEVARLMQRIAQEYEAAQRGLTGLCLGTARMEQIGTCHEALKGLVGEGEATRMLAETLEAQP